MSLDADNLLAEVASNATARHPRLVYADYVDEYHGMLSEAHQARAAMIREATAAGRPKGESRAAAGLILAAAWRDLFPTLCDYLKREEAATPGAYNRPRVTVDAEKACLVVSVDRAQMAVAWMDGDGLVTSFRYKNRVWFYLLAHAFQADAVAPRHCPIARPEWLPLGRTPWREFAAAARLPAETAVVTVSAYDWSAGVLDAMPAGDIEYGSPANSKAWVFAPPAGRRGYVTEAEADKLRSRVYQAIGDAMTRVGPPAPQARSAEVPA